MPSDTVQLLIDGTRYAGWTDVSISRSIEILAGKFDVSIVTKRLNEFVNVVPGAEVSVLIGDNPVISGYIDSINQSADAAGTAMSLAGRDRTADLVDCSSDVTPLSWNKKQFQSMAALLCIPFGIQVERTETFNEFIDDYTLDVGASPFELLNEAAKAHGVLLLTNPIKGNLLLTQPGDIKATDSLIYSKNIKSVSVSYEYANRFARYIVKGQRSADGGGWTPTTVNISGEATDANVRGTRVKIIKAEKQATAQNIQARAEWEAITRAAQAEKLDITVVGFRQTSGELWRENMLVDVTVSQDLINIAGQYLIVSVQYKIDNGGFYTTMMLKRPDAYIPEPRIKKRKTVGLIWR